MEVNCSRDTPMRAATRALWLALLACGALETAFAAEYYVDAGTGDDRHDGLSETTAFEHIAAASARVVAGDVVWIRGGASVDYVEPIEPPVSGTPSAPIRYQGYGATMPRIVRGEAVAFDPHGSCIYLREGLEHIVVDGIDCDGAAGSRSFASYATLSAASHNQISSCVFRGGDQAALVIGSGSRYNRIVGNLLDPAGPGLEDNGGVKTIQIHPHAGFNLVAHNEVRDGGHDALWVASSFNVIRANRFRNPDYRAVSVIALGPGEAGSDPAERNLFEGNEVYDSNLDHLLGIANAFQLWAPRTIIRRNRFHDTGGHAIKLTRGDTLPLVDISDNRIYHNVFHHNGHLSWAGGAAFFLHPKGEAGGAAGNALVNNVLQHNDWASEVQLRIAGPAPGDTRIEHNVLLDGDAAAAVIDIEGAPACEDASEPPPTPAPLSAWQACYPSRISGNLEQEPLFVDAANGDFRLAADSPLVDAGGFLTRTTGAGAGVVIPVEDAGYFYDGFGIEGEQGDRIRLEGGASARIVEADYARRELIVAEPIRWEAGEGVHVFYHGEGPDIGAYERRCGNGYYLSVLVCVVALRRRPRRRPGRAGDVAHSRP